MKIAKIVLLTLLVVVIGATFTACSIIEGLFQTASDTPEVTEVTLTASGLTKVSKDVYTVEAGKEFTLRMVLNSDAPAKPKYKWYLSTDGEKQLIDGENGNTLKYSFDSFSASTFVFSSSADGVESKNEITVTIEYATALDDVVITSSSHDIVDGAIQQSHLDINEVTFFADWNKTALPDDTEIDVAWTVGDDTEVLSEDEEFKFTPSGVGTFVIKLSVSDGTTTLSSTVSVVVVEKYSAVDTVTLTLTDGAEAIGSGVETQYLQTVTSETRNPITLTVGVTPIGETDLENPVTWIVRDKDGERTLSENGRTVEYTPAYGETMIKAVVDNVESKHIVIFAFTETDYEKNREYVEDVFVWKDGVENAYLTDQTDLNRFMQYAVSTRRVTTFEGGSAVDPTTGFPFETADEFDFLNDTAHSKALNYALNSVDEAGYVAIRTGYKQQSGEMFDYVLYIADNSRFMTPTEHYSPAENVTQDETAYLHYAELDDDDKRTALPIDDNPEYPTPIVDSQMLYRVVGWGYKPVFDTSAESQKMKALYEKIRQVAIDYVAEDMSDYMKALIFYEWIAQHTDYDYAIVADDTLDTEDKLIFNAFSLEGVFADADGEGYGQAVCDGRAKAYVILCGLEDITAIRVTGQAYVGGTSEGHAWNKVLIDANGDGVKEWYLCDTTWSDRSGASDRVEMLNKQYFLVTDEYTQSTHIPDDDVFNPDCDTVFDYYGSTVVDNGDKDFDMYINSYEELKNAVVYARDNGMLLEIKVSSTYASSASELYSKIRSILTTNGGGEVDNVITLATASNYGIYTITFE